MCVVAVTSAPVSSLNKVGRPHRSMCVCQTVSDVSGVKLSRNATFEGSGLP